jgi:hypothetical protein
VDWGKTFNLPVRELNEAPIAAKRAIANAVRGVPPQAPTAGPWTYNMIGNACGWRISKRFSEYTYGTLDDTLSEESVAAMVAALNGRVAAHPEQHTEGA